MTSKWVRMVARQLNAHIDYDAHFPPEYEAGHTAGLRLLRVAARTRAEHGREAVAPLYAAYGAHIFEREQAPARTIQRRPGSGAAPGSSSSRS
jgi:hypothetical protein